jgi:protein FRA10AC1
MSRRIKNITSEADREVLRENYEFAPSASSSHAMTKDDEMSSCWQDRMLRRYNEGLYKEYALVDISRPDQIGLRWRTKQEVVEGRGEKSCGNKRCLVSEDLCTVEVPFAYTEAGISKKELVKLRLCPGCLPQVLTKSTSRKLSKRNVSEEDEEASCSNSSSSPLESEKCSRKRLGRKDSRKRRKR